MTVPDRDLSTGDHGTWEVNLRGGTIAAVDAIAQEAAASCPPSGLRARRRHLQGISTRSP